jgi:hypothetical protein
MKYFDLSIATDAEAGKASRRPMHSDVEIPTVSKYRDFTPTDHLMANGTFPLSLNDLAVDHGSCGIGDPRRNCKRNEDDLAKCHACLS